MDTLELEGTSRLDLVVVEAAVVAVEGHDDNLAEIGNLGEEEACHAL